MFHSSNLPTPGFKLGSYAVLSDTLYVCVCVRARVCVHAHTGLQSIDHPPTHPTPSSNTYPDMSCIFALLHNYHNPYPCSCMYNKPARKR